MTALGDFRPHDWLVDALNKPVRCRHCEVRYDALPPVLTDANGCPGPDGRIRTRVMPTEENA